MRFAVTLILFSLGAMLVDEYKSGMVWEEPRIVDPGPVGGPPSDAKVLFNGQDMSQWDGGEQWQVQDGYVVAAGGDLHSKESFGDCQLHLEFASPPIVKGEGQGRGNSGVYLMDRYEVQILDSYENRTYYDGQCGSIYKQTPPMVNACRKPGEWQAYDILFTAPTFNAEGRVTKPAAITVLHNGVAVQNHFELSGATFYERPPAYTAHPERAPIRLQFHGDPVRFRNIWIRELVPAKGAKPE
jgi:hypothetical protein